MICNKCGSTDIRTIELDGDDSHQADLVEEPIAPIPLPPQKAGFLYKLMLVVMAFYALIAVVFTPLVPFLFGSLCHKEGILECFCLIVSYMDSALIGWCAVLMYKRDKDCIKVVTQTVLILYLSIPAVAILDRMQQSDCVSSTTCFVLLFHLYFWRSKTVKRVHGSNVDLLPIY